MPANQRGAQPGRHSIGPRNVDVKRLNRRPQSPDDFAGPERFAQQSHPAVFRLANGAKRVAGVRRLVRVQPALREVAFERGVNRLRRRGCSNAERLAFESLEELPQLLLIRLGQNDATLRRIAQRNLLDFAKLSHPLDVAEKIHDVRFVPRKGRKNRRPDISSILAAHRLAVFGFEQLESHRFHVAAEVQRLHVQRKRRQFQRTASGCRSSLGIHSSDSSFGNFARNSGACFRTSSQSKKASGVSSQMRNQPAISSFSARLCASTLWLREIISARRLPSRATFKTRSTAACSPCARNLRISSSSRMMLTSASCSVLKCNRSSNSSSYCSSASSCWLMRTFCPASFSTSAMYSVPILPASPCSARSRRRSWSISAGVHCWTLISLAVSRIRAFFVFKSSVIGLCLGAAWFAFSWAWAAQAAVAVDRPASPPATGDTSLHSCCVPPGLRQKSARPAYWPQNKDNLFPPASAPRVAKLRRDFRSGREEARRAHTYCTENRTAGPSPLVFRCIFPAAPFHK